MKLDSEIGMGLNWLAVGVEDASADAGGDAYAYADSSVDADAESAVLKCTKSRAEC